MLSTKRTLWVAAVLAALLLITFSLALLSEDKVLRLTREDGPIETMGAGFFFIAAVLFFMAYRKSAAEGGSACGRRNLIYLLLAALFFVGGMEEISWGQRIFGIATPDAMRETNMQGEINLHNLKWVHKFGDPAHENSLWQQIFSINRLFTAFCFGFGLFIPLLAWGSDKARGLLARLRVPIVPIPLGLLFVANHFVSLFFALFLVPQTMNHEVVEIKEMNFAWLFAVVALVELLRMRRDGAWDMPKEVLEYSSDILDPSSADS